MTYKSGGKVSHKKIKLGRHVVGHFPLPGLNLTTDIVMALGIQIFI